MTSGRRTGGEAGGEPSPARSATRDGRRFRTLLRLLPAAFRKEYGREMEELFERRMTRAKQAGAGRVLRLWARTAADLLASAGALRMGLRRGVDSDGGGGKGARQATRRTRGSSEGDGVMIEWIQDTRYAARRLARSPVFTLAAVAILAVGIGANTAAFSVVDAALFRPPPFERPEEIVHIYQDSDEGVPASSAYPAYLDIAERTELFAGVAATSPEGRLGGMTWETADGPRAVSVDFATSSYFPVLGLQPSAGTWFAREHDFVGAGAFAVVTWRTWQSAMGGAPDVVGSSIRLNGEPVTVIGIGPRNFNGPAGALVTDFWLSISSTPLSGPFRVENLRRREDHWYDVVARLRPDVTVPQVRAAMDALAIQMGEANPELDRGRGLTVYGAGEVRLRPEMDGPIFSAGVAILGVVGMVLLLACSNLANMLLLRGVTRAPEMAVRQALGAGRHRLARLFLVEAVLLAGVGAVAGVLLARWAVGLFPRLALPLPPGVLFDVVMDGRVLAFSALLALASALFFGFLPSLRASGQDVAAALREDVRAGTSVRRGGTLRKTLVAVQVAVSLVLMIGAGLLARSLGNLTAVRPGVDVDRLAFVGLDAARGGVAAEDAAALMEELMTRIGALPQVTSVALSTRIPVARGPSTTTVVEDYAPGAGTDAVEMPFAYVSPGYFETMGIRVLAGRGFVAEDRRDAPRVVVVNEAAAQRFWGGDPIGKRLRPQGSPTAWREVVGVVSDVKVSSLEEPPTPMMYYATSQAAIGCCYLYARTDADPEQLVPALRAVLQETAPHLLATRLGPLGTHLGDALAVPKTTTLMMGAFSLLALVLATLGVYAVVSFAVARRSAELGIRIALGAARGSVVAMVVRESLVPVTAGAVVGLCAAVLAAPYLEGALFGIGRADPIAFAGGAALLMLVAGVASWVPAWRAARTDPVEVLKAR